MSYYDVHLSGDAIVSVTIRVEALSMTEAKKKAMEINHDDLDWEVSSLHEPPMIYSVRLRRKNSAVGI